MNNSDEQRDQLWGYLDKELDAEASGAFEKALFTDEALAGECAEREVFNQRISQLTHEPHLSDEEMARITQAAWEKDMGITPVSEFLPSRSPWMAIVSLAAALILAFVLYHTLSSKEAIQWAHPHIALVDAMRSGGAGAEQYRQLESVCKAWQEETTGFYLEEAGDEAPAWKLEMVVIQEEDEQLNVTIKGHSMVAPINNVELSDSFQSVQDFTNRWPELRGQLVDALMPSKPEKQ